MEREGEAKDRGGGDGGVEWNRNEWKKNYSTFAVELSPFPFYLVGTLLDFAQVHYFQLKGNCIYWGGLSIAHSLRALALLRTHLMITCWNYRNLTFANMLQICFSGEMVGSFGTGV